MSPAKLTLQGVARAYGPVQALHPLDLAVGDGEFVTLLGPSGCGKTTILRIVAGFLAPSAGRVLLDGRDVVNLPPNRRDVGMVFQNYALFPHLSVADNVSFAMRQRGASTEARARRVAELLDLVDLAGYGPRLPSELSGGQRQRVAVARAVAHPPRILLMDEPLGALDQKLRETMQTELRRIQRALGITTLYVTHDQTEAMTMSDRVVVMNQGRVEQIGTPQEIYLRPRSRFVASFIGRISLLPLADGQVEGRGIMLSEAAVGPATLGLRPESVRVARRSAPPPPPHANALPARVRASTFAGSHVQVILETPQGGLIAVDLPQGVEVPEDGEELVAWWRAEDGIVLPAA